MIYKRNFYFKVLIKNHNKIYKTIKFQQEMNL